MLLPNIQQQISQHFPTQTDFLIGLSGGIDSVVLLHLFSRTKHSIRAAYIHHGLSPNADKWAAFCQQLCQQWHIPFVMKKVQVSAEQGIEAGAREARYHAISQIIYPHEIFVTAHHLDDQAETFLLALKRGSGVKGLSAMQAVSFWQKMSLFRPLLQTPKSSIRQYAEQHHLAWIEDESNTNTQFDRNFLRNDILPLLNQRWEQFNQMVARSAAHCANQQALLEELLSETLANYADFCQKRLNIGDFHHFSSLKQQQLIRLWLEKCGEQMPTTAQLTQILAMFLTSGKDKNPQFKLGEKMLRRYQAWLYLTPICEPLPDFTAQLQPHQSLILPNNLAEICHLGEEILCKKMEKTDRLLLPVAIQHQPVTIKLGQKGKVNCYGKTQREEMKKIWQVHQIPVWERDRTPLLFWQDDLIGVFA